MRLETSRGRLAKFIRLSSFRIWIGTALISLSCSSLLHAGDSTSSSSAFENRPAFHFKSEDDILAEVNLLRMKNGLSELKLNHALQEAARNQSLSMAQSGYLAHKDSAGRDLKTRLSAKSPIHFRTAGENITRNRGFADPAGQAVGDWTKSPGHLENILNKEFSETGIGAVIDSKGTFYFTQLFLAK